MAIMKTALVAFMAMAAVVELGMATNYTVGDSSGWTLGVDYQQWASGITFLPGDFIIFSYSASFHDVLEVTSTDYAACNTGSPISTDDSGDTTVALTAIGTRYFICGLPNHCPSGMHVEISVVAPPISVPPSSSPSPAPAPAPAFAN